MPVGRQLLGRYSLDVDLLTEIAKKERAGYVLVSVEEGLNDFGKRSGAVDVVGQVAFGNVGTVLMGDIDSVQVIGEDRRANLTLYFVEELQYTEACRQRRAERAEGLRQCV